MPCTVLSCPASSPLHVVCVWALVPTWAWYNDPAAQVTAIEANATAARDAPLDLGSSAVLTEAEHKARDEERRKWQVRRQTRVSRLNVFIRAGVRFDNLNRKQRCNTVFTPLVSLVMLVNVG